MIIEAIFGTLLQRVQSETVTGMKLFVFSLAQTLHF